MEKHICIRQRQSTNAQDQIKKKPIAVKGNKGYHRKVPDHMIRVKGHRRMHIIFQDYTVYWNPTGRKENLKVY